MNGLFPEDSAARKTYPVYSGLLAYFPSALAAIARHSYIGNEKHNPGQVLHHDRAKSDDEADALVRHLMESDYVGMAWRALSLLQKHCEAQGSPIAPAARNVQEPVRDDVRSAEWVAYIDGFPVTGVDTETDRAIEASYAGRVVGASSVDELLIEALIESQAEDPPLNCPESPGEAAPIMSPDNGAGV